MRHSECHFHKTFEVLFCLLDCFKHDRRLCHECVHVGMCDGKTSDACDFISLAEFESNLNERLAKLDAEFSAINDVLKTKKEAFIEMYRKDPRKSHDKAVSRFREYVGVFNPTNSTDTEDVPDLENVDTVETHNKETKQSIVCNSFSDDNEGVTVSSCKRSVKVKTGSDWDTWGYCFLNHPKLKKNQILKWTVRVPKYQYSIGMVIVLETLYLIHLTQRL